MQQRIAIAGIPKSGKTTFANEMGDALHTDDLIELGWSEASQAASRWFDKPGPLIVEGVAVPRALRKWLRRNPEGKPVDKAIFLDEPHVPLSPGQNSMGKGCQTVWLEILPDLLRRGVIIGQGGIAQAFDTEQGPSQPHSNLGAQPLSEETIAALSLKTDEEAFLALLAIVKNKDNRKGAS